MEKKHISELTHGDHIKATLMAYQPESTGGQSRKRLVFYPTSKGDRTITQFIFENSTAASTVRTMWARNLAEQTGREVKLPTEDKLVFVDGMKRSEAQKHLAEKADQILKDLADSGEVVTLWMYRENGYTNFVPYEKYQSNINQNDDIQF